jgi:hypothetical protein
VPIGVESVTLDASSTTSSANRSGREAPHDRTGRRRQPKIDFRRGELVAAQFYTVAAVAEECDALVATGVTPTGVWR